MRGIRIICNKFTVGLIIISPGDDWSCCNRIYAIKSLIGLNMQMAEGSQSSNEYKLSTNRETKTATRIFLPNNFLNLLFLIMAM